MDNMVLTLAVGVVLIIAANLLLVRISRLDARQAPTLVALATLAIYVPLSIIYWPGGDIFTIHIAIYLIASLAFGMIAGARQERAAMAGGGGRGRIHWGPVVIIAFFVLLVAVDSVLVMLAQGGLSPAITRDILPTPHGRGQVSSVFPGTISHDFQKKELLYNEYLAKIEQQRERGWQIRKGWVETPVLGEPATFIVDARTRDGNPLRGAEIQGQFLRPSDSRQDTAFVMNEVEPGFYRADLRLGSPGDWNLILELRKGEDVHEIRASTSVREH